MKRPDIEAKRIKEEVTNAVRPQGSEGGRSTTFPGVYIESMEVEKPPFNEPGVVQEFVGPAATKDFNVLKRVDEVGKKTIQQWMDDFEELVGPLNDTFRLRYIYLTRALTARLARPKVRAITRAKNPFEPDVIEVGKTELVEEGTTNTYRVPVTVTK